MMSDVRTDWRVAERVGRHIGHTVEAHASIGSTNDRARDLVAAGGDGVAVVAEEQTAGRGRRGRTWISPPGANLTASVGVRLDMPALDGWRIGIVAGLAVRAAVASVAAVAVDLKWPNDVVAPDGRKVGGMLIETAVERDRLRSAVIGFGINVNWGPDEMPADLRESASSLSALAGREIDRVALLRAVLSCLERELGATDDANAVLDRYRAACSTLGHEVTVETAHGPIQGRAESVDEGGGLVVSTRDGPVSITTGEVVRVRGLAP